MGSGRISYFTCKLLQSAEHMMVRSLIGNMPGCKGLER